MVKYDENTCFWCGKTFPEYDEFEKIFRATYSLGTDTLQTCRSFCGSPCFNQFKRFFKYQGKGNFGKKPVVPYKGGK